MWLRLAISNINSGSNVPSIWTCNSAFGQGLDQLFDIHIFSDFRFIFNIEGRLKLSDGLLTIIC